MPAAARDGEPLWLNAFYSENPQFLICPATVGAVLAALTHGVQTWGAGALHYVAYSLVLEFAIHGWMCCYGDVLVDRKIQRDEAFNHSPAAVATRQTAVLLSNVLYAFMPLRPTSSTWAEFAGFLVLFALAWDAYFFVVHRAFHRSIKLYNFFHRLHHRIREPMCFTAYYVTYQSHLVTEQLVFIGAAFVLPQDVLLFALYYSTLETFLQHAGVEIDHLRLPLLPIATVGHVRRLLSFYSLPFGTYTTAHHDWHHEKNSKNYALAFTYLDRLAGTHYAGRQGGSAGTATQAQPGEAVREESQQEGKAEAKVAPPRFVQRQVSGG